MLGKLLKYDFKSLYRTFLPLWGVILALAVVTRFMEYIPSQRQGLGDIFNIQDIAMIVFVSVIIAVMVITAILIIQRFYKGLLRDEGYLMFTLPVAPWKLVLSKLLSATSVVYVSMIVGWLSILILLSGWELNFVLDTLANSKELEPIRQILWLFIPATLLAPLIATLHAYLAMAIGHLVKKHRIGVSIGAYLGINIVLNIVTTQIAGLFMVSNESYIITSATDIVPLVEMLQDILVFSIVLGLAEVVAFFFLTVIILHKGLNLE